jgi:hypothetical protein
MAVPAALKHLPFGSLDADGLDTLARLDGSASPAPWFVREMDDNLCMSAVGVSTQEEAFTGQDAFGRSEWAVSEMVAGCLVQSELRIVHSDGRWQENALLIATVRNCLPELLRLARIGLGKE